MRKTDWTSLRKGGRLAVGDPQHVPAGIYAKEALQKLGVPGRRCRRSSPRLKTCGALALVERNQRRWGLSCGSDAVASKGVKVVGTFPKPRIRKSSTRWRLLRWHRNAAVSAFYDYLKAGRKRPLSLNVTDLPPADV